VSGIRGIIKQVESPRASQRPRFHKFKPLKRFTAQQRRILGRVTTLLGRAIVFLYSLRRAALATQKTAGGRPKPKKLKEDSAKRRDKAWQADPTRSEIRQAVELDAKLWGGFSRSALRDLEELKGSVLARAAERRAAAWYLARRCVFEKNYARALENAIFMRQVDHRKRGDKRQILLEVDCLSRLGQPEEARKILDSALAPGHDPDLCLAYANTYVAPNTLSTPEDDEVRLKWINRVYEKVDLLPLVKADPNRPLAIDNLTAANSSAAIKCLHKISVIVSAYKAEDTLPIALNGLLEQTWRNLEVIVVDDCSADNTYAVAEKFARRDPRIIPMRLTQNQGAYSARNAGLERASGDFITTHDADDWSHPQKIENQVSVLLGASDVMLSYTDWVRTRRNLRFTGPNRPFNLIHENRSSTLFRRELFDRYGVWDEVRVSADTEYILRLQGSHPEKMKRLLVSTPLSFSIDEDLSLTRKGASHISTRYHGVRREYLEAAQHWHTATGKPRIDPRSQSRAFPAPGLILPDREDRIKCDLLFIMDFNLSGGAFASTMNYVNAAIAGGLSVALFHWRRYDLDVTKPLKPEIRQMAQGGKLRIVAPGEKVQTSTMIAVYPVLLQHVIDLCPDIEFDNFLVIVNQMAARLYNGGDVQYDPLRVRDNLRELFGTEGAWVPVSGLVRQLMEADPRYPTPHADTWTALIDTTTWCTEPPWWRGQERLRPVVGRHGRDHYTKWPSSPDSLHAAYCTGRECDVAILGGVKYALNVIGALPGNWTVYEYGALDVRGFLSELDFFVHYPHEEYIEEGARSVIEAMAIGRPVLLPPIFESIFGAAALYVKPADVWATVKELWSDEEAYLARAQAGREFVKRNCDWKLLKERLERLNQSVH
jgi:glycosyltransferase involved in cell wall biosynthesis